MALEGIHGQKFRYILRWHQSDQLGRRNGKIMNTFNLFIIIGGIFTIFCAFMDYDWFLNHYKAKLFVALFGRNGARGFYIILGIILIFLGLMNW